MARMSTTSPRSPGRPRSLSPERAAAIKFGVNAAYVGIGAGLTFGVPGGVGAPVGLPLMGKGAVGMVSAGGDFLKSPTGRRLTDAVGDLATQVVPAAAASAAASLATLGRRQPRHTGAPGPAAHPAASAVKPRQQAGSSLSPQRPMQRGAAMA